MCSSCKGAGKLPFSSAWFSAPNSVFPLSKPHAVLTGRNFRQQFSFYNLKKWRQNQRLPSFFDHLLFFFLCLAPFLPQSLISLNQHTDRTLREACSWRERISQFFLGSHQCHAPHIQHTVSLSSSTVFVQDCLLHYCLQCF